MLKIRIWIGSGFIEVPGSVSGSRRAKMTHKIKKNLINFISGNTGCFLLRDYGFSSSLDVL
jgi:hypothetical protein